MVDIFGGVDTPANLQANETASTFRAMQTLTKYGRLLGSLLSAVLLVIGLADLPQQLAIWQGWLKAIKGEFPWWVFVLWSVVVFALTWGPGIWNRRRRRRELGAKASEADVLRGKLEKATTEAKESEKVTERVRDMLNAARKELETSNTDAAFWHQETLQARELLNLGARLIDVRPLKETERVMMRGRVQELMPAFHLAIARASEVWKDLRNHADTCGESHPLYWLHRRVDADERGKVVCVMSSLSEDLQNSKEPRPLLACAYTRYRAWRTWILRLAELSAQRLEGLPSYPEWREADARFFDVLREKLAIDELSPVREAISRYIYEEDNGPPEKLPPPLQS